MGAPSRTVEQKTNHLGFPKPGELIEMTGTHVLTATDRAIANLLYQHAHDSGRILEPGITWEIPMATLREAFSKHESADRLRESVDRLMSVRVAITDDDGELDLMHLVDRVKFSTKQDQRLKSIVKYRLPPELMPILETSGRWGRIKAEVVCSMTSKYAMALYELLQLRANMERCIETFTIERFRELLGVPPHSYERADNFQRKVIDPAVLEVNGLSDMSVRIELLRKNCRAPVRGVVITWWRKSGDEFRAAMQERNRSKVGRMARLKAKAQHEIVNKRE